MKIPGVTPDWIHPLLAAVEANPTRRWRDRDLRARGLDPARVRRWFQAEHGMTFHAYSRACRLGQAIGRIREGSTVSETAFASGYESLSGFNEAFRKLAGGSPTDIQSATGVVVTRIGTPLGPMVAAATSEAVCLLEFADRPKLPTQFRTLTRRLGCVLTPGSNPLLVELARELEAYFETGRADLSVPLLLPGTPFQTETWAELRKVPAGSTVSYAELARRLARPSAVRAVARANGDNRIAILVPCHRVIGSDGSLTGYGGGIWRKRKLLELEGVWLDR
jgi:AraC family transcriptional regulator of adaptative response/methylated-DNA-[protein]-cysteine methyltransferase